MSLHTMKQFLSGRLVKRRFTRQFRRLAILEMLRGVQVGGDVPPALIQSLTEAAFQEPEALLAKLNSHTLERVNVFIEKLPPGPARV